MTDPVVTQIMREIVYIDNPDLLIHRNDVNLFILGLIMNSDQHVKHPGITSIRRINVLLDRRQWELQLILVRIPTICSVRLYLQLFVGGIMSYLRCLFLLTYSGVQHILCCIFVLIFSVLWRQFLWIVHFWLPLRYSPTFI